MPIPFKVLVLLIFMPILLAWIGAFFKFKQFGYVNNADPRSQSSKLTGAGARLVASQANAWEALIFYTGTLLVAYSSNVPWSDFNNPAMLYAATRIVHPICYLYNVHILRSLVFSAGFISCAYMIYLAW